MQAAPQHTLRTRPASPGPSDWFDGAVNSMAGHRRAAFAVDGWASAWPERGALAAAGLVVAYSTISSRAFLARAAPMAVPTFFSSSGGGSTAGMPSASIHSSRAQPVV